MAIFYKVQRKKILSDTEDDDKQILVYFWEDWEWEVFADGKVNPNKYISDVNKAANELKRIQGMSIIPCRLKIVEKDIE